MPPYPGSDLYYLSTLATYVLGTVGIDWPTICTSIHEQNKESGEGKGKKIHYLYTVLARVPTYVGACSVPA